MRKENENLCHHQTYYSKEIKNEIIERINIEQHIEEKEVCKRDRNQIVTLVIERTHLRIN